MRVPTAREEMRLPERQKVQFSTSVEPRNEYDKSPLSFFALLTTLFATLCE
jgi:hypothetical protein